MRRWWRRRRYNRHDCDNLDNIGIDFDNVGLHLYDLWFHVDHFGINLHDVGVHVHHFGFDLHNVGFYFDDIRSNFGRNRTSAG